MSKTEAERALTDAGIDIEGTKEIFDQATKHAIAELRTSGVMPSEARLLEIIGEEMDRRMNIVRVFIHADRDLRERLMGISFPRFMAEIGGTA